MKIALAALLASLLAGGGGGGGGLAPAAPPQVAVEWTITSLAAPDRTLLFPNEEAVGNIALRNCATWDPATRTLVVYAGPTPLRVPCYPARKAIRRHTNAQTWDYALSWADGATPFGSELGPPGTTYPYTVQPDGGLAVGLP